VSSPIHDGPIETKPLAATAPVVNSSPWATTLRVLIAIGGPIVAIVVFWWAFGFLRSSGSNRLLIVIVAIVVGVVGVFTLFWAMDRLVDLLPGRLGEGLRPYVFVGPALVILSVFLVYPVINTIIVSFKDAGSSGFFCLAN